MIKRVKFLYVRKQMEQKEREVSGVSFLVIRKFRHLGMLALHPSFLEFADYRKWSFSLLRIITFFSQPLHLPTSFDIDIIY